jgi:hypothetical protein
MSVIISRLIAPSARALVAVATVTMGLGFAAGETAHAGQAVLPALSVTARSELVNREHRRVVLVRELRVVHADRAWRIRASCEKCSRPAGKVGSSWSRGTFRLTGLRWRVSAGNSVTVTVVASGAVGRWVTLLPVTSGPRAGSLKRGDAGCLDGASKRVECPAATAPVVAPAAPAVPVTTVPAAPGPSVVLGGDPTGRLSSAERVGLSDVRLLGWARDPDAADSPVLVTVQIDGLATAQGLANVSRPDAGPHGFDLIVPIDAKTHVICIQAMNLVGGRDVQLPGCVALKLLGDLSGDGYVGCDDVHILTANGVYKQQIKSPADLNGDGWVNILDLNVLITQFAPPPGEPPCA